jgi:hypothetical protein
MTDYLGIVINAVCVGIGVAIGNEFWQWFKKRRKKMKFHFNKFSDNFNVQMRK